MPFKEFIFTAGVWLGEGKISFSHSSEFLKFYTKWEIFEESAVHIIKAVQVVEMQGVPDKVTNSYIFSTITATSFTITLDNNNVSSIAGKGIRDKQLIAWEFLGKSAFEGFEVYEQQDNGDYFLHAEYGSSSQYKTIVEGLVWFKTS